MGEMSNDGGMTLIFRRGKGVVVQCLNTIYCIGAKFCQSTGYGHYLHQSPPNNYGKFEGIFLCV